MPIYSQVGTALCYAYTASDLVNYQLMSNGNNLLTVNPLWIAFNDSTRRHDGLTEGGFTADAIKKLNQKGICLEEKVQEKLASFTQSTGLTEAEFLNFLDDFFIAVANSAYKKKSKENENEDIFQSAFDEAAINLRMYKKEKIQSIDEFQERLMAMKLLDKNVFKVFMKDLFLECHKETLDRTNHFTVTGNKTRFMKNQVLSDELKTILKDARGPIAIGYCSGALTNQNYDGVSYLLTRNFKQSCLPHASSIVGSRLKNNQCQFLLRNSYGDGWGEWTKSWSCFCQNKKTAELIDECAPSTHPVADYSVLGCWLPAEHVVRNTTVATWLK